jgi:alkylated DNA repair protein alkB family protein 1
MPDAALINYYRPGDTLGGHVDDAEQDMAQPIVTASLGLDAVFLIGGETRHDAPSALLLRSGDVLVLAGAARRCFHGVPRVFDGRPLPEGVEAALVAAGGGAGGGGAAGEGAGPVALRQACYEQARGCRINVSVRCIS